MGVQVVADMMAPDDILRACGYLEAVWMEDAANMAALLDHGPEETSTPVLVTQLGDSIMQLLLPGRFGIHDGLAPQALRAAAETMHADPAVRVSKILIETLKEIAPTANPGQSEAIARVVLSYMVSVADATPDTVLPVLSRTCARARSDGAGASPRNPLRRCVDGERQYLDPATRHDSWHW
ncbi:hypothetical protein [Streptomyces sp. BE133]|uniref:hypothetical protein n=1 Tax=Streptomyces sp. BE133 TaxID=3002523 RepID=UPI002E75B408|nr:hypothetical protein [Streptomyces sp. BE133]MEE1812805.1 hypothetical protein [Streptomyces sp. BE133]